LGREVTLESERIYEGRVVSLRRDTVRLTNGRIVEREIVEHNGAVGIVAVDGKGNVLLVRQYRKPAEAELVEIPAGTLSPGEEPLACAQRELREETGYRAEKLQPLGGFYSSPGFCTEFMHIFLATGLRPDALEAEYDEEIEVLRVPFSRALEMVERGEIRDAKTIAGLLLAHRYFQSREGGDG